MGQAISPNHFTRTQLQDIAVRCDALSRDAANGLTADSLQQLAVWAATLDAQLAAVSLDYAAEGRYRHVFDNPWQSRTDWLETRHTFHTPLGLFFLSLARKVIIIPGHEPWFVGTHCYRLSPWSLSGWKT
jgi:hypothetical protein